MNQLLTLNEAAEILKVSRRHLTRMVDSGRLPVLNLGERTRRIPAYALDEFIKGNTCLSGKGANTGLLMSKSVAKGLDALLGVESRTLKEPKRRSGKNSYPSVSLITD